MNNINWLGNSVVDPNANRNTMQGANNNYMNEATESAAQKQNNNTMPGMNSPRYPIDMDTDVGGMSNQNSMTMPMTGSENMTAQMPMAGNENMTAQMPMAGNENMTAQMPASDLTNTMESINNYKNLMDMNMGSNSDMMDMNMGSNSDMMGASMKNQNDPMYSPTQNQTTMRNVAGTTMGTGSGFMGAGTTTGAPTLESVEGPPPVFDREYIAGYLMTLIGRRVLAEFIIGNNFYTDKAGTLTKVGVNYFVLKDLITNADVMCDLYSVRFVTAL